MITTVTRDQFFKAVQAVSGMNMLYQNVSAETNSPNWVEFWSAKRVQIGVHLYVATQMALGYTSDQMLTLFAAAVQVPL